MLMRARIRLRRRDRPLVVLGPNREQAAIRSKAQKRRGRVVAAPTQLHFGIEGERPGTGSLRRDHGDNDEAKQPKFSECAKANGRTPWFHDDLSVSNT
jgi:hypothetical protein